MRMCSLFCICRREYLAERGGTRPRSAPRDRRGRRRRRLRSAASAPLQTDAAPSASRLQTPFRLRLARRARHQTGHTRMMNSRCLSTLIQNITCLSCELESLSSTTSMNIGMCPQPVSDGRRRGAKFVKTFKYPTSKTSNFSLPHQFHFVLCSLDFQAGFVREAGRI